VTVKQIVENEDEFKRLPRASEGVRPWWPWHEPPRSLVPAPDSPAEYILELIAPGHWVGVWRTEAVSGTPRTQPELAPARVVQKETAS